jgi:hypothetical protein
MHFNFLIIAIAALIPLLIGFIWYNPKVCGTAWIKETGLTEEQLKSGNMSKIFILLYIFSFLIAFFLGPIVIHQFGLYSIVMGNPDITNPSSELSITITNFMAKYGSNFRTFKHGALHGTMTSIFLVMPIVGINALFERKTFKYTLIHTGFWAVCLAIMGGLICQFS